MKESLSSPSLLSMLMYFRLASSASNGDLHPVMTNFPEVKAKAVLRNPFLSFLRILAAAKREG